MRRVWLWSEAGAVTSVIAPFVVSALAIAGGLAAAGCSDAEPAPMVEQIRLSEVLFVPDMPAMVRTVFGFGTHPLAGNDDAHPVTAAKPAGNRLRVIVNKLLLGNNLEEIACRFVVDTDVFARIPVGVTPDDVARCAVPQAQLARQCPGSDAHSLCLCQNAAGCQSGTTSDGTTIITPRGESVGVQDRDQDGAADALRLIDGVAKLTCDSAATGAAPVSPIDVPIDLGQSYWTPSGNQDKPVQGGFDALGPAIVVVPLGAMPVGQTCSLAFSPDVTDKAGTPLCAPAGGELALGCTPGDLTAFSFGVAPLAYLAAPEVKQTGQSRIDPVAIEADTPIDPASLGGITVTQGAATPYTDFSPTLSSPTEIAVQWNVGLAPRTRYTIVVPTTVTDTYGIGAPQAFQVAFTTGD